MRSYLQPIYKHAPFIIQRCINKRILVFSSIDSHKHLSFFFSRPVLPEMMTLLFLVFWSLPWCVVLLLKNHFYNSATCCLRMNGKKPWTWRLVGIEFLIGSTAKRRPLMPNQEVIPCSTIFLSISRLCDSLVPTWTDYCSMLLVVHSIGGIK